jgi:hypothetical protein
MRRNEKADAGVDAAVMGHRREPVAFFLPARVKRLIAVKAERIVGGDSL